MTNDRVFKPRRSSREAGERAIDLSKNDTPWETRPQDWEDLGKKPAPSCDRYGHVKPTT